MLKKYMLFCIAFYMFLLPGCIPIKEKLSEKIIDQIDKKCDQNGDCTIDLSTVIHFEWDTAVFFETSCSSETISEALGIQYEESYDFTFGMIFAYEGKVVYKELFLFEEDSPNRFWIRLFDAKMYPDKCVRITKGETIVNAYRFQYSEDEKYYYTMTIGFKDDHSLLQ